MAILYTLLHKVFNSSQNHLSLTMSATPIPHRLAYHMQVDITFTLTPLITHQVDGLIGPILYKTNGHHALTYENLIHSEQVPQSVPLSPE